MKSVRTRWVTAAFVLLGLPTISSATDRFYSDIEKYSDSTRYRLAATSPDNQGDGYRPFQADFTYVLSDTENDRILWTRKQPMIEVKDPSGNVRRLPEEGSPTAAFVNDDGWTVIRLAGDDYLMIDQFGKIRGKVNIVDAAFSEQEQEEHLEWTTAGTSWAEVVSHFLSIPDRNVFVVRTGWGRIIAFDLEKGTSFEPVPEVVEKAKSIEASKALLRLRYGLSDPDECLNLPSLGDAIHLAGVLELRDSVEMLRALEESDEFGSSVFGGKSVRQRGSDEIDPHQYRCFSLRSGVQWALRKLGEKPKRLPLFEFGHRDGRKKYYRPPVPNVPASDASENLTSGMLARDVLDLMGSPTNVTYDEWIYLIDDGNTEPYELVLDMDHRSVTKILKRKPAE